MDASQQARVDALNRALEKLPPQTAWFFVARTCHTRCLRNISPGAVVTERAFLSTSMDPAVAQSAAFAGNVEFRIVSRRDGMSPRFRCFPANKKFCFQLACSFTSRSRIRSSYRHDDH